MRLLLTALWYFLPAGIANTGPVFGNKIPGFNRWETPLDFGLQYKEQRIFGPNKRIRGLVVGIVLATLVIGIQKYLFAHYLWVLEHSWFDYRPAWVWLLGPLFGTGALLGDAVESFFKRQRGIPAGQPWFPLDQLDYIIGGLLFAVPFTNPSFGLLVSVFVVYFGLHLAVAYCAYLLRLKDTPI